MNTNSFVDRQKYIKEMRERIRGAEIPTAPYDVPTPHYVMGGDLQTVEDLVSLLLRPHGRIVFFDGDGEEMQNWITEDEYVGSLIHAVTNLPYQSPWGCREIGVFHVEDGVAVALAWYKKHEVTIEEWRRDS